MNTCTYQRGGNRCVFGDEHTVPYHHLDNGENDPVAPEVDPAEVPPTLMQTIPPPTSQPAFPAKRQPETGYVTQRILLRHGALGPWLLTHLDASGNIGVHAMSDAEVADWPPLHDEIGDATVQVDPILLMYAFRYALGRMTYAVGDVAEALIANVERLRPDWRQQITRDIETAIAANRGGMIMDTQRWQRVADVMAAAANTDDQPWPPLGPGEDDAEVWIPPATDAMLHRPDEPCPHCGSALHHVRTRRCGCCGRRP